MASRSPFFRGLRAARFFAPPDRFAMRPRCATGVENWFTMRARPPADAFGQLPDRRNPALRPCVGFEPNHLRMSPRCDLVGKGSGMSEPDSLYLRVRLSKGAFERYLASKAADADDFDDWMPWLGRARMHGLVFTREKIAEIARGVRKRSTAEEIAGWTKDDWAFARSHYDELTETWRFGVANFSENYQEFLVYLPPLRAVGRFKDLPGADFMLVYDHFLERQPLHRAVRVCGRCKSYCGLAGAGHTISGTSGPGGAGVRRIIRGGCRCGAGVPVLTTMPKRSTMAYILWLTLS